MSNTATQQASTEVTYLRPVRGLASLNFKELWKYRELFYFLTWRDVKVRYKQAVLGIGWAILQPLLTMVIFSIIFGQLAKLQTENGIPYPIYSYAALLPWRLFAGALQRSGNSLVGSANLITKVYFPRLVIPASAVTAGLVDLFFSFLILMGLMAYYQVPFSWRMLWLIPLVALAVFTAIAVGLWLSALNVRFRDVQQMIPFLIEAWMYASPVVYSARIIPTGKWQIVYALNPMAGVIQGFRWALLDTAPPDLSMLVSFSVVLVIFISGLVYFRKMERTFADIV